MITAPDLSWQQHGLCRNANNEVFYDHKTIAAARQLCQDCSVQGECLEYALKVDERYGIWGGATERQRETLIRHVGKHTPGQVADYYVRTGRTRVPKRLS